MGLFKCRILIIIIFCLILTNLPSAQLCTVEMCVEDLKEYDCTFWPWSKADPSLHIDEIDSKENIKTCPFYETEEVSDVRSYCFKSFTVTQSTCKMLEVTARDADVIGYENMYTTYVGTHTLTDGVIQVIDIDGCGRLRVIPSGGCSDFMMN